MLQSSSAAATPVDISESTVFSDLDQLVSLQEGVHLHIAQIAVGG